MTIHSSDFAIDAGPMTTSDETRNSRSVTTCNTPAAASSAKALRIAAAAWFVVTALGQLMFVIYIAGFYGVATARGDLAAWSKVMPHGYVAGDTFGNTVVGFHLLFAALIMLSGAVQLIPAVRRVVPKLHRWNGRFYLFAALLMSVGGLLMVGTRGTVGGSSHVAISLNAVLILLFGGMALRNALARRFAEHRRWALRLFLAVSGVWFFRIGLMGWIMLNQGPVGFDPETFTGPFLTFLGFAQYLIPLALLQAYFYAQDRGTAVARYAMTGTLAVGTLVTLVGTAAATMMMWLPYLQPRATESLSSPFDERHKE